MVSTLFWREVKGEELLGTFCRQRQAELQIMLDVNLPCERGLHSQLIYLHIQRVTKRFTVMFNQNTKLRYLQN